MTDPDLVEAVARRLKDDVCAVLYERILEPALDGGTQFRVILSQREAQDVAAGYVPNAVKAVICSMLDWDEIEQRKSDARAAATTRLKAKGQK